MNRKINNQNEGKLLLRIAGTIIVIFVMVLIFLKYMVQNRERIGALNADYLRNTTEQTAGWVDDVVSSAQYSINNTAALYSRSMTDRTVEPEELQALADRMVFDYVDFIGADGIDINVQGAHADISDRDYFAAGMQGKTGLGGIHTYRVTGEKVVTFYAPVRYQGEIVGVLAGHYLESRMKEVLANIMFDEQAPALMCLKDGTIVSTVGVETTADNVFDYLEGMVSEADKENIRQAVATEGEYDFSCRTPEGATIGCAVSTSGNQWTIIQFFPEKALQKMEKDANRAGFVLQLELIALFVAYIIFLLLWEWRLSKRLMREKQEAERIIQGINSLFSRFIRVDLEQDSYQYMNGQKPGFEGLPEQGKYSDFLEFFSDKLSDAESAVAMKQNLLPEVLRENLAEEFSQVRYECLFKVGEQEKWNSFSAISLTQKEGRAVIVLLAVQDITEVKHEELRTQLALKEAYQSAEAANHAKSEFLSRMSHDIRTPMNAIMGMTAIAALHMDERTRVEDCLNKISISSQHLLRLINEVLDMSKIESGKLELMDGEFDLSDLLKELMGMFHSQMETRGQTLSVVLGGVEHEKVIGDEQRLSQVLVNIMGNAVKFTPEGGSVSIQINELPPRVPGTGCYEFIFTDTGIGMDEEFIKKIFEPFTRSSDSRTDKVEGTGLGMAIARSIVRMMGGDIQVKSKKGQGTQIKATVFLQFAENAEEELDRLAGHKVMVVDDEQAACESACQILNSIQMPADWYTDGDEAVAALVRDREFEESYVAVILDWKMPKKDGVEVAREIRRQVGENIPIIILSAYDWSAIEKEALEAGVNAFISKPLFRSRLIHVMKQVLLHEQETVSESVLKPEEEFAGKRILLVEDNELNMEIAEEILTTAGFSVDKAYNGKEAVERVQRSEPGTYEVVLMDIQMPLMDGYEASRAIRGSDREDLKTLPILAMTADAFTEDVKKAEDAGMNGHIAKPVDIGKLMELLKSWV